MEELHQQGKDLNLVVIGLSVDKNQDAVQKFVQDNNLNYPIITNSEDIADQYGLSAIPNTFFISGIIHLDKLCLWRLWIGKNLQN